MAKSGSSVGTELAKKSYLDHFHTACLIDMGEGPRCLERL